MRSLWWAGSHAALAIGLLWVTLAVINLYRRDRPHDWPPWPSDALVPGEPIPMLVGVAETGERVDLGGPTDALIVLLTEPIPQAYAAVVAASATAERHDLAFLLAIDGTMPLPDGWRSSLPASVMRSVVRVPAGALRRLQLAHPVSLVVTRGGVLRDAIVGPRTLFEIEDRFGVFLGDTRVSMAEEV